MQDDIGLGVVVTTEACGIPDTDVAAEDAGDGAYAAALAMGFDGGRS